jgi:hypothetical protein
MRAEAVNAVLSRAGATWTLVDRLMARGDLIETSYAGHRFFLRRYKEYLRTGKGPST